MAIEDVIFTRLTGHAGLAALVAVRVYALTARQGAARPYVVYRRVSATRPSAMGSDIGVVRARFQFDVFADSFASARDVREQLRQALQRWRNTTGTVVQDSFFLNQIDLYEPDAEPPLHHFVEDYEINYEE